MDYRPLGKTGLAVSVLGFGCGAVGGLLIKEDPKERARAVARAIDLGITYFDTAAAYGDGASEANIGLALQQNRHDVVIGSKIRLGPGDLDDIEASVVRLVDESLRRLRREAIDLIQLHNLIGTSRGQEPGWLSSSDVLRVLAVFARLQENGKLRFWGINGMGDVGAVRRCLDAELHSIQVCYNLLNPTAALKAPAGFPFADQGNLIRMAADRGIGVLAFRVLAGGALSGSFQRHANATQTVETILSSGSYDLDVRLAKRLSGLVETGATGSLVEAAIRFAIGTSGVSSAVIGFSTIEQMEEAARHTVLGALPDEALVLLNEKWAGFGAAEVPPLVGASHHVPPTQQ